MPLAFLAGGGEMGALMRAHDGSGSPLGPGRHLGSLGRPAREAWEEIWPVIGPQIQQVRDLERQSPGAVAGGRGAPGGRELPARDCVVDADETRLLQVLSNLINNAAKFTPEGGLIEVGLRCDAAAAVLSVRDDGIGIPPDMLGRVFDMFTQVHRSHARLGDGLGIGLTLVRQLVERHGGSVVARSDGPGLGSEFVVRLPLPSLASQALQPPAEAGPARPALARPGLRVLVADDNEDAAATLSMLLALSGNEVRTASDGAQAWAIAQDFEPQAVLLDIAMSGLDGHEVCRRVRATGWGRDALLIASSGWGQAEMRRQSADAGFDHHLVKPLDYVAVDALLAERSRGR